LESLKTEVIDFNSREGKRLVEKCKARLLPLYYFEADQLSTSAKKILNDFMDSVEGGFMLKPSFTGVSFVMGRTRLPRRLDLFFSLFDKEAFALLSRLREFTLREKEAEVEIHFLAEAKSSGEFLTPFGSSELDEDLRLCCIKKYYPDTFWQYLLCRAKNPNDSWWMGCLEGLQIDMAALRKCATSQEGRESLENNSRLGKELDIYSGPTFLLFNQEIFSATGAPSLEELEGVWRKAKETK
jgi:hypothetical protein